MVPNNHDEDDDANAPMREFRVDRKVREAVEKHSESGHFDSALNREVQEIFDTVFPSDSVDELITLMTKGESKEKKESKQKEALQNADGLTLELGGDDSSDFSLDDGDEELIEEALDEKTVLTQIMGDARDASEETGDDLQIGDDEIGDLDLGDELSDDGFDLGAEEDVGELDLGDNSKVILNDLSGELDDLPLDELGDDLSDETGAIDMSDVSDSLEDESLDLGGEDLLDDSLSDDSLSDDDLSDDSLSDDGFSLGEDDSSDLDSGVEEELFSQPVASKAPSNVEKQEQEDFPVFSSNASVELQATIKQLRQSRQSLMQEVEKLKDKLRSQDSDILTLRSELDESKIEVAILERRLNETRHENKQKLEIVDKKREYWELKFKKLQGEAVNFKESLRVDVSKIRSREKELESKLELLTIDAQNQVRSRDEKILELKRKIDALEFNMENSAIKEQKSKDDKVRLEEKLARIMKTLRGSIEVLEDDIDSEFK